jgi:hypothetical protein
MIDEAHLADLQHECAAIEAARAECWCAAGSLYHHMRVVDPPAAQVAVIEYPWLAEAGRQALSEALCARTGTLSARERLEMAAGRLRGLLARCGPSGGREALPEVLELVNVLADWLEDEEARGG